MPLWYKVLYMSLIKQPIAWLPLLMSLTALLLVLGNVAIMGPVRQPDEGTAAHLFQILIAAQVPVVLLFAVKWLSKQPGQALGVLGLQALAVLIALAPVFYWKL